MNKKNISFFNHIKKYLGGLTIKLTVLDKILLHLYDYRNYVTSDPVPEAITQLGIAAGVNINYSHVPRAVKRLSDDGQISEGMAHIVNHPSGRRRKSYFLTENGLKSAKKVMSILSAHRITFKDENGVISEISLPEINKYLMKRETILKLYTFLDSNNTFDLLSWLKTSSVDKHKIKVIDTAGESTFGEERIKSDLDSGTESQAQIQRPLWLDNTVLKQFIQKYGHELYLDAGQHPRATPFLNRVDELKILQTALGSPVSRIILITGENGIGKSSLVSETLSLFEPLSNGQIKSEYNNVIWLDILGVASQTELISLLSTLFLKENDPERSIGPEHTDDVDRVDRVARVKNNAQVGRLNWLNRLNRLNNINNNYRNKPYSTTDLLSGIIKNPSLKDSILILDGLEFINMDDNQSLSDIIEQPDSLERLESGDISLNQQLHGFILNLFEILPEKLGLKIIMITSCNIQPGQFSKFNCTDPGDADHGS